MVPQPYKYSLCFITYCRYGNLTILKFSSKWVKVMLPYREGKGYLYWKGGGSQMLCNISNIAFKYVMASEPYSYTWYLKQVMAGLPYIKIYF
jgi:hypothetical protein